MSGAIFKLGGGIQGFQPKLLGGGAGTTGGSGMDGASTRGIARKVLRTGFGRFGKKDWSEGFRLDIEGRPENGEYFRVDESDPLVVAWVLTLIGADVDAAAPGALLAQQSEFFKNEKYLAWAVREPCFLVLSELNKLETYSMLISPYGKYSAKAPCHVSAIFNSSFEDLAFTTTPGLFTADAPALPHTPTSQVFYQLDKNESITPFRQAYNAGDPNGYINQSSTGGESNHLNNIGLSSSLRVYARSGGVKFNGKATFAGNPKFVYAGDDYIRFKKLAAINKTYNDKSFGGDESNASFTSLMANY